MKVSGYIITKNNGRSLKWALESVYKYLDEIIIVDSGSTDNTVEIAKQYTDKIYFNEFKDFSDQRNFAIKKCTGDWIFTMDADEVMGENFFEFKKYLKKSYRAILFPRYNLVSLNPIIHIKTTYHYSDWQARVFKNDGYCYYVYPVHHQLKGCKPRLKVPNINIFHLHWLMYGYDDRKKRGEYYDKFEQGSSFKEYYLFENFNHKYLKGIENIEESIFNILKNELIPVEYKYKISLLEQIKYCSSIKLKHNIVKLRNLIDI